MILLDITHRRTKGVRTKGAFQAEFVVDTQVAIDADVRKLLHRLRVRLASHYQDQLRKGERAIGRGSLPKLTEATMKRTPGRPNIFGVNTGELAKRWLLFKISGGPSRATSRIKPWGGDGRRFWINKMLKQGVDLQSIQGQVSTIIARELRTWATAAAPAAGDGVGTPASSPNTGGEIHKFRKTR